jgi:hypothetical protein
LRLGVLCVFAIALNLSSCGGGNSSSPSAAAPNPVPSVSMLTPAQAAVGSPALNIAISGSDFVAGSVANWNGVPLATSYISASQLAATVPATELAKIGTASVVVVNPAPGGGSSTVADFTVNASNPLPSVADISPASAAVGSPAFTLTVNGSDFVADSSVTWSGQALATTYVSASKLQAAVPASDLAAVGSASVAVVNPAPGGGTSAVATFAIDASNPAPTISSLSPSSAAAGSTAVTLTVNGSNFVASSTVNWNGGALATSYASSSRLTALVPASLLVTAGSASVTVENPAPGGGTSTAAEFSITSASTGAPAVRQVLSLTGGQTQSSGVLASPWSITITVQEGSALWVLGTVPIADDIYGTPNYQYPNIYVSDGTNTYTNIARVNDENILSDGLDGTQAFISWTAVDVPAGTYTVSMLPGAANVTEDWVAVAVVEITGVSHFDAAGSNLQTQVHPGTNTVSASATSTSANSFLIAACFDDESSGTHPGTPAAGTGFTDQGSYWPLFTAGGKSLRIESLALPTPGSQSASCSPTEGADSQGRYPDYLTLMAIYH